MTEPTDTAYDFNDWDKRYLATVQRLLDARFEKQSRLTRWQRFKRWLQWQ